MSSVIEDEEDFEERITEWPEGEGRESKTQQEFREDMEEAGYEHEFYYGRFYYKGWAVRAENFNDLQNIIRATDIYLQWDQLGKDGYIVYPQ
jgi:hypothetical protein